MQDSDIIVSSRPDNEAVGLKNLGFMRVREILKLVSATEVQQLNKFCYVVMKNNKLQSRIRM